MCDENKTIRTKNTDAPWALSLGNTELLVRLLKDRQRQSCQARCRSEGVGSSVYSWDGLTTRGQRFVSGISMSGSWVQIWYIHYARCQKQLKYLRLLYDTGSIKWCRKEREFSFSSSLHEATCSRPPLNKMLCFTTMQMMFSLSFPLNLKRSYLLVLLFAILAPGAASCLANFYCLQRSETSSLPS